MGDGLDEVRDDVDGGERLSPRDLSIALSRVFTFLTRQPQN
jgi:hypothetical protein